MEYLPFLPSLRRRGLRGGAEIKHPSDFLLAKEGKEGWL